VKQMCQFSFDQNPFFRIGMLILSQLIANDISSNDDIIFFAVLFGSVVYLEIVNKVLMSSKFNQLVTKVDGCGGGK